MSTIREELQQIGPEGVRSAMIAFEHRSDGRSYRDGCGMSICCFLTHVRGSGRNELIRRSCLSSIPDVERAFENWYGGVGREALRQECIAFLAEHGTAIEQEVAETVAT